MKAKKVLFILHRLYFDNKPKVGGVDRIIQYLSENNTIVTIEHPFEKINHPSTFSINKTLKKNHVAKTRPPLLWFEEVILNMKWIFFHKNSYDLAVASDPLNCFSCLLLKYIHKVHRVQFHSTDYSNPRFANPLLEAIYQWLYKTAIKKSDIVTVVSQRMYDSISKKLDTPSLNKLYLLPNSPVFNEIPKYSSHQKSRGNLVLLVGRWGEQINTLLLIHALNKLTAIMPSIKLHIIGEVSEQYKNSLGRNFVFHGNLPYKKALEMMAQNYIGITAYSHTNSYVYYGDSLKIREYAAAGLPTVCDTTYSTASEMVENNAGLTFTNDDEMVQNILRLIKDKKEYEKFSLNALMWAGKMDKKKLLDHIYNQI